MSVRSVDWDEYEDRLQDDYDRDDDFEGTED